MWNGFSGDAVATLWGAGATVLTGVLAVGAAIIVGWKQAGISKRQSDIADRQASIMEAQTDIERGRVAHELYDRRYRVYEATSTYLSEATNRTRHQSAPRTNSAFHKGVLEAHFLFPNEVVQALQEIRSQVGLSYILTRKMARDEESLGRIQVGDYEKQSEFIDWIWERYKSCHTIFPQLILYREPTEIC